jgi:hypothetical protein
VGEVDIDWEKGDCEKGDCEKGDRESGKEEDLTWWSREGGM